MLSTPLRFLPLLPQELRIATVLRSGQSFRWHQLPSIHVTLPDAHPHPPPPPPEPTEFGGEWAIAWADRTIVLRQTGHGLHYRAIYNWNPPHTTFIRDLTEDTTLPILRNYFQLETPLVPLYKQWADADSHFAKKIKSRGTDLEGIRILNQPPWETLISFIISSNNNISRIGQIVQAICTHLGARQPHPSLFDPSTIYLSAKVIPETAPPPLPLDAPTLFSVPHPSALAHPSLDATLRKLGTGYRAPYLVATAQLLLDLAEAAKLEPADWLETLRKGNYDGTMQEAREQLQQFVGVGPKVADCIALFSLGWHELVPVDTHVFQIAIRDYAFPASRATAVTPALNARVAERLRAIWGSHAGWCQQVLFFADLKAPAAKGEPRKRKPAAVKEEVKGEEDGKPVVRRLTFEEEVQALIEQPGKRRRVKAEAEERAKVKKEGGRKGRVKQEEVEGVPAVAQVAVVVGEGDDAQAAVTVKAEEEVMVKLET